MYILNNLWDDGFAPLQDSCLDRDTYNAILHQLAAGEDALYQLLPQHKLEILETYQHTQEKLFDQGRYDAFICGVQFGAKLMLDILK